MIERCPRCDYLQTGLPAEHDCPECGLGFDERSEVWKVRFPRSLPIVYVGLLVGFCPFLLAWETLEPLQRLLLVLAVMSVGGLFAYRIRNGLWAVVGRKGVAFRSFTRTPAFIKWGDIFRAQYEPSIIIGRGMVTLILRTDAWPAAHGMFRSRVEAKRFAALVNERSAKAST